jgi:broad specificity phosphatase PhoE
MTKRKNLLEFYFKLPVAALALLAGCAMHQTKPEPVPVPGTTVVYLVRHGEKVLANPSDPDPDISLLGRNRAQALATRLGASGITAIITTQFKRTQQTAKPLADQIGVTPEIVHAGNIGDTDSAAIAVMRHRGGKVLVVGHTNTIAPIIAALGGPKLPNICDNQYSNLFVLYIQPDAQTQLIKQHYGNGDPPPDSECITTMGR